MLCLDRSHFSSCLSVSFGLLISFFLCLPLSGQEKQPPSRKPPDPAISQSGTAPQRSTDKQSESSTAKNGAKPAPARLTPEALNREKAQNLLNRCYQEAITIEPALGVPALMEIAKSMQRLNSKRTLMIYEQAFQMASELQDPKTASSRASWEGAIAREVSSVDLERALQMALRMERIPGKSAESDARRNALGRITLQLSAKDPDRAFDIVREEISRGDCPPSFVVTMASALKKTRPDRAEILFLEAIRQFDKPVSDGREVQQFLNLTQTLFDLNPALTLQALDEILKAIDYLGDHPPSRDVQFEFFDGRNKTSVDGVREYAIVEVVAMIRRLDPERAKALEKRFSEQSEALLKYPEGYLSPWKTGQGQDMQDTGKQSAMPPGSDPAQNPPWRPLSSSPYMKVTFVQRDSAGSTLPTYDVNQFRSYINSQSDIDALVKVGRTDPDGAEEKMNMTFTGPNRILAMARMAATLFAANPEKAKAMLSDAALAAEKVSDPFDRAECDAALAEGFALFNRERAQRLIQEAIRLADGIAEKENEEKSNSKRPDRPPIPNRKSSWIFSKVLISLSKLSIDDAIARAEEIKDPGRRLHALVMISDTILSQNQTSASSTRVEVH